MFTSVIPNLLVEEISKEIAKSRAKKIYVCNIMTQPGETDNYAVSDHVRAIMQHANSSKVVDAVLVNDFLPKNLADKYERAGSYPVKVDAENVNKLGIQLFSKKLIEDSPEGLVRHSSTRVARSIYSWYRREVKSDKNFFLMKELHTADMNKEECKL